MKKTALVFLACTPALPASAADDDTQEQEALFARVPAYFRQSDPQWVLDLLAQLPETPLIKADSSGQFSSGKFIVVSNRNETRRRAEDSTGSTARIP